jgi:hypothetical protein
MQYAHGTALVGVDPLLAVDAVVPRLATAGAFEPPQPEASTATPAVTSPTTTGAARLSVVHAFQQEKLPALNLDPPRRWVGSVRW